MAFAYLLDPSFQTLNENGLPLVGGHIEVFYHNSHLPYITKSDFDGTDNPFEVPLNSKGMAVIIADVANAYDVYCYNAFNSLFWSRENITTAGNVLDGSLTEAKFSDPLKLKTIKDYVTPEMFGAVGDGLTDDTDSIQDCIDYANSNNKKVLFSGSTYRITNSINIIKNTAKLSELIIDFNQSTIVTNQAIDMIVVDKTNIDSSAVWANGWRTTLKNLTLRGSDIASCGLKLIHAQGYSLNNFIIEGCIIGIDISDTYYGAMYGHNIINRCLKGIRFSGTENNGQSFNGIWITAGNRVDEENSIAISMESNLHSIMFDSITIESFATPISSNSDLLYRTIVQASFVNCYFENNTKCIADFSSSEYKKISFAGCHVNELQSYFSGAVFTLRNGSFVIVDNDFRDNYIRISGVGVILSTDMKVSVDSALVNNGWQTYVEDLGTRGRGQSTEKVITYRLQDKVIDGSRALYKFKNVSDYSTEDIVFEKEKTAVLRSPNGKMYRLLVADDGTLSTEEIASRFALSDKYYNSIPILDIIAGNIAKEISNIRVSETGQNFYRDSDDGMYYTQETQYIPKMLSYGNIAYISSIDFSNKSSMYDAVVFMYNTDINMWYVLYDKVWRLVTGVIYKSSTYRKRAYGTTAQRPTGISNGFVYYDTDETKYIKWNGSSWEDYI